MMHPGATRTSRSAPLCVVVLIAGSWFATGPCRAHELSCTVRSVQDATVTLTCPDATPHPGDPVTIGFELDGVGFVTVEGAWSVSLIGPGGEVMAVPGPGPHGRAKAGHLARVESSAQPAPPGPDPDVGRPIADDLPPVAHRPTLGVRYEAPSGSGDQGAKVVAVVPGGAAAAAGVLPGDVILAVDGIPTPDRATITAEVARRKAGETVSLRLLRFPSVIELEAALTAPSLDDPLVQEAIGRAYLFGEGVPADRTKAQLWLGRAAARGNVQAAQILADNDGLSTANPPHPGPGPTGGSGNVFIVSSKKGNRKIFNMIEPEIREIVAHSGAHVCELSPEVGFAPDEAPKPTEVSKAIAGRGSFLYFHVKIKSFRLTPASDRIVLECYDPSGRLQWSEETSSFFKPGGQPMTTKLANRISEKLAARYGQACLRP